MPPFARRRLLPAASHPRRRTHAPQLPGKKLRAVSEILEAARYAAPERDDYIDVVCQQCGSGHRPAELLLCDKGFHMKCVRPIVAFLPMGSWLCPDCSGRRRVGRLPQKKIIDFFGIRKTCNGNGKCGSPQGKNFR